MKTRNLTLCVASICATILLFVCTFTASAQQPIVIDYYHQQYFHTDYTWSKYPYYSGMYYVIDNPNTIEGFWSDCPSSVPFWVFNCSDDTNRAILKTTVPVSSSST